MARITPLRTDTDGQSGWQRYADYQHAATETVLPVGLAELPQAIGEYTLAFARLPDGSHRLVALMGLQVGQNLYVNNQGRWCARYVPSQLRAYPFVLAKRPNSDDEKALVCFDQDSGLYRETPDESRGEQRFFDESGEPQPFFKEVVDFLQARQRNMVLTQRGVDTLAEHGLLRPWRLPAAADDQDPLVGFYHFDEEKFNAADGQTLEALRNANALTIGYAQLLSMPKIRLLVQMAKARSAAETPAEVDVEALFGEKDDTLKFNF